MGCGKCVKVCPTGRPRDGSHRAGDGPAGVLDYCVDNISEKPEIADDTVKGSQFKQPLLEFSGSCAGCAETAYARLITQLFGDRMYISNATGCSSIWGGPAATSPYTVNKQRPRPRMEQLPVRGQRRARPGHAHRAEAVGPREPDRRHAGGGCRCQGPQSSKAAATGMETERHQGQDRAPQGPRWLSWRRLRLRGRQGGS